MITSYSLPRSERSTTLDDALEDMKEQHEAKRNKNTSAVERNLSTVDEQ
jgi:hypothetical protein